eukprot:gene4493-biopygen11493
MARYGGRGGGTTPQQANAFWEKRLRTRPGRARFFKFYRVGRVRDVRGRFSLWRQNSGQRGRGRAKLPHTPHPRAPQPTSISRPPRPPAPPPSPPRERCPARGSHRRRGAQGRARVVLLGWWGGVGWSGFGETEV